MTKPQFLTPKFIESAVRFLVYALAVTLTPFLGRATAHMWDWVAYGCLHALFAEIHTGFFWLVETIAFYFIGLLLKKKGVLPERQKRKDGWSPLPRKNLFVLSGVCIVCVLLLSAVIGFQVKPFYDLGEKVTGYEIWCAVGGIGRNAVKCLWVMAMMLNALRMADELVAAYALPQKPWLRLLLGGSILMLFGLVDIFTSVVSYPLRTRGVLLALVYFLFYALFPLVYYYAEENKGKAYAVMAFIYLF